MQASFYQPMLAAHMQDTPRRSFQASETGDAVLDVLAGFNGFSSAHPGQGAFQPIHLPASRPIHIAIQQSAGLDGAFLDAAMSTVNLLSALEVRCELATAR